MDDPVCHQSEQKVALAHLKITLFTAVSEKIMLQKESKLIATDAGAGEAEEQRERRVTS